MAPRVKDVSASEFAADHGVTRQRVYQWIGDGLPHRKRGSVIRIVRHEANKWLREQAAKAAPVPSGDVVTELEARRRKTMAEAELKEAELAQLRRTLVPAAEAEAFVEAFVTGFSAVAAGQLGRFEREMGLPPAEARILRTKIHTALMQGAQSYADEQDKTAGDLEESTTAVA